MRHILQVNFMRTIRCATAGGGIGITIGMVFRPERAAPRQHPHQRQLIPLLPLLSHSIMTNLVTFNLTGLILGEREHNEQQRVG